jgi:hypothetical protein
MAEATTRTDAFDKQPLDRVSCQRALEALRNGVPNGDAVRALGCAQSHVLERFERQLAELERQGDQLQPIAGSLITGDFGAGKSHLLGHLEHLALSRGFVVSRVVVSKEMPIYDPTKVFLAAARDGRILRSRGPMIHELAQRMDYRSSRATPFVKWANAAPGMLAATIHLHERSRDEDLIAQIVDWWSGEKLPVAGVRAGLKQVGTDKAFDVKAMKLADLAPLRFELVARLARAVGFKGWVILIDEIELVGRYSLQQRGRSYAELERWLGGEGTGTPGVAVVATITDDFDIEVLHEKGDISLVGERLRSKGTDEAALLASRAEAGMRIIERDKLPLIPPTATTLHETLQRVRDVYRTAYGWQPPDLEIPSQAITARMRTFIRRWINEWDLLRLYPGLTPDIEEDEAEVGVGYTEDTALETESSDDGAEA